MAGQEWYKDGLNFSCTQCGNCCTGSPGYVWITREERQAAAEALGLTLTEFTKRYVRRVGAKYSLKELNSRDNWDCVFLESHNGLRTCSIYMARPQQCRTWPFWDENLRTRQAWDTTAEDCPGIDAGEKHYEFVQIEVQRTGTF